MKLIVRESNSEFANENSEATLGGGITGCGRTGVNICPDQQCKAVVFILRPLFYLSQ